MGLAPWLPALVGFLAGAAFLWVEDKLLPHLHPGQPPERAEGVPTTWHRSILLVLAIMIHNIPEGLAIGVAFGALAHGSSTMTLGGAIALAVGIGLQNLPEGTAVSVPLRREGFSRPKELLVRPAVGHGRARRRRPGGRGGRAPAAAPPYALAFAAGAMLYVVLKELIPESQAKQRTSPPWARSADSA